jgi:uncharacterized Zn finger protein
MSTAKARALLRDPRNVVADPVHEGVYAVRGSRPAPYRVQVIDADSATCTCPNGVALGGFANCYHVGAVRLLLERTTDDQG